MLVLPTSRAVLATARPSCNSLQCLWCFFKKVDTFQKHYQQQHFKWVVSDSTDCDGNVTVNDDALPVQSDNCADLYKKQEALFLLKLNAGNRLTDDALADVTLGLQKSY